ncbi:hypothetical protein PR048_021864 [Dryococelus australis]|uniref:Uncharacterized protein n=1 Tax=Dryococelus australis TaxID=614101 RepID=A0ABQ9GZF0_9NEOP|nr:hypothetical protein PR048_021864 [Dryococelus australis]
MRNITTLKAHEAVRCPFGTAARRGGGGGDVPNSRLARDRNTAKSLKPSFMSASGRMVRLVRRAGEGNVSKLVVRSAVAMFVAPRHLLFQTSHELKPLPPSRSSECFRHSGTRALARNTTPLSTPRKKQNEPPEPLTPDGCPSHLKNWAPSLEEHLKEQRGAVVTQRLDRSPSTKTNHVRFPAGSLPDFSTCGQCRWLAGFLGDLPAARSLSSIQLIYCERSVMFPLNLTVYRHVRSSVLNQISAIRDSTARYRTAVEPFNILFKVSLSGLKSGRNRGTIGLPDPPPPSDTFSRPFKGSVRGYLNEMLPQYWSGRGAAGDHALHHCPPRSLDLTSCVLYIWWYIKDQMFRPPLPANTDDLKTRITDAIQTVTPDMLTRVWNEFEYCIDRMAEHLRTFKRRERQRPSLHDEFYRYNLLPRRIGSIRILHLCLGKHKGQMRCEGQTTILPPNNKPTSIPSGLVPISPRCEGAMVAGRFARSPPTKANRVQSPAGSPDFRKWESCRTMPLVGGFSRESPVSPASSFRRRSIFTSIGHIGSHDLTVKSRSNLFASLHSTTWAVGVSITGTLFNKHGTYIKASGAAGRALPHRDTTERRWSKHRCSEVDCIFVFCTYVLAEKQSNVGATEIGCAQPAIAFYVIFSLWLRPPWSDGDQPSATLLRIGTGNYAESFHWNSAPKQGRFVKAWEGYQQRSEQALPVHFVQNAKDSQRQPGTSAVSVSVYGSFHSRDERIP